MTENRKSNNIPFINFVATANESTVWYSDRVSSESSTSHFENNLPTVTITAPTYDDGVLSKLAYFPRKFSFQALRKFSGSSNISRSDSVVSICYKTLTNYVEENNLEELRNYLETKRGVIIDDKDENGCTVLHIAATQGKHEFVKELLEHDANPNVEDNDNWTPLLFAARGGFKDICLELLSHGARVNHQDAAGWNSIMWASYKGYTDTVLALIDHGADVNSSELYRITPLVWAAGRGHSDVVDILVSKGAKVNYGDKYGTTPLIWACRKGDLESVRILLKAGAAVDISGIYSWTPLLVATMRNYVDIVNLLLEYKPNVNTVDSEGCSPLTIACKEGFHDIALILLNAGAFINIQDRHGDTNIIHAVRNGHYSLVDALLKKYADVNIAGKDHKTPAYIAAEKGNVLMLKLLLNSNPDLEIPTKDGDTVLLRAVRSRSYEMVKLLLDRHARVCVADKKGDTALHIAIRSSSKHIVEILLRNPSHGQLLYRPNRDGETPYTIDLRHQKPLLSQVYGANRLNTNEDNEDILGYDLYSSTLADMLSAPSVSMPVTVGLYARWGSGKNFLLKNLTEEMKIFAQQWVEPLFKFHYILMILIIHVTIVLAVIASVITRNFYVGCILFAIVTIIFYVIFTLVSYGSMKYDYLRAIDAIITQKENNIRIILQLLFCSPPGIKWNSSLGSKPIRFYFTDHSRVSTTVGGENAVVQMIGSLFDAIEADLGVLPSRLYRAYTPKAGSYYSPWRWRKLCCVPTALIFEMNFICFLVAVFILANEYYDSGLSDNISDGISLKIVFLICSSFLTLCFVSNLYPWIMLAKSLLTSPRRHLQHAIASLDTIRSEGFLQTLRSEVAVLIKMVRCLDGFSNQQSRLVVIVDGLDSCEQEKVLLILDAVHVLFSESSTPFIIILAIDPHVISMVVETNTRRLLNESNITGRDFLRNMVHVPFYLQNSGLRKVKIAQKSAMQRKSVSTTQQIEEYSGRRMSCESAEKLKVPLPSTTGSSGSLRKTSRNNSRKLKISDSVNSSIASNMNKLSGAQDLTRILAADDYFSDMNPRSMRRLLNIVYITGRLLKAFQIDFSWYQLAVWVNITEQWPYRTSCLILYHDANEETLDESISLKALYDKIRPHLPTSKELEPLLEFDRDEKKFNVFLKYHRNTLLVNDLRVFLPFTINLDPYIKKVIKEDQQLLEDRSLLINMTGYHPTYAGDSIYPWSAHQSQSGSSGYGIRKPTTFRRQNRSVIKYPSNIASPPVEHHQQLQPPPAAWSHHGAPSYVFPTGSWLQGEPSKQQECDPSLMSVIPDEFQHRRLSTLTIDNVCDLLYAMNELKNSQNLHSYINTIKHNNISGRVLSFCNLDELKKIMNMAFGDWELFNSTILSMRELEYMKFWKEQANYNKKNNAVERKGSFSMKTPSASNSSSDQRDGLPPARHNKQTVMEKQVTLEDQMLMGALQTLNEEAYEDIVGENGEEKLESSFVNLTIEPELFIYEKNRSNRSLNSNHCPSVYYDNQISEADLLYETTVSSHWRPVFASEQNISSRDYITSSSHANTPLQRRRILFDEKHKTSSLKSRSRPSSLQVSNPEELQPVFDPAEIKMSRHKNVKRSHSADGSNLNNRLYYFENLLENRSGILRDGINNATSASALSTVSPINDDISDDNESTPLVSDLSSPRPQPSISRSVTPSFERANNTINNCMSATTELTSPCSTRSNDTRETPCRSSSESINNLPSEQTYCQFTYVNERTYHPIDSHDSETVDEANRFSWSDTETAV